MRDGTRMGRARWRLALAACAIGSMAAMLSPMPASAAAGMVRATPHVMRPYRSVAEPKPASPLFPDLLYGGGPVQHHPTVYLDFWGAEWTDGTKDAGGYTGGAAQNYIEAFIRDTGGSTWFASQTRYCDGIPRGGGCIGAGVPVGMPALGQVWNDAATTPTPTDAGIVGEAINAAAHFGVLNVVDATVLVLTPTGQSSFTSQGRPSCGFHSFTSSAVFGYIPWMPDGGASCAENAVNPANDAFGHGHFDGFSIVVGREVASIATDPEPGLPINGTGTWGWLDEVGLETGDKCQDLATLPATNATFGAGSTNSFAVQPLWSNSGESCPVEDLGGGTTGSVAAASWGVDHRDVFIRGLDGALWYRRWNGVSWSGWTSLGGFLVQDPAAVSWGVGRTDVFGVGRDDALWHIAWTGSGWSGWQSLGGLIRFGPAVASWTPGGLDVAAIGLDAAMWHLRWSSSGWSQWQKLGGGFSSSPGAVSWRDGSDRVDIFGIGLDGSMWQDAWTGTSWSGWLERGGLFIPGTGPGLASTAPGRLQVFGIGQDFGLWHETWNGTAWSGWTSLGGFWVTHPAAVPPPSSGAVDVFMANGNTERLVPGP